MTYLDAAYHILQQAGYPLRYEETTERALAQQLILPQGLTPETTTTFRLYTDTLQKGYRFKRAGKATFDLVDWRPAGNLPGRKDQLGRALPTPREPARHAARPLRGADRRAANPDGIVRPWRHS